MHLSSELRLFCFIIFFCDLDGFLRRWPTSAKLSSVTTITHLTSCSKETSSDDTDKSHRFSSDSLDKFTASVITVATAAAFFFPIMTSAAITPDTVQQGMAMFRTGDVKGSVNAFDAAVAKNPKLASVMWQRGLSLYYAGQYEEGSKQFRFDITANPSDAEEIIWTIMCDSKLQGYELALKNMPLLPKTDRRPVMRTVYNLFRGEAQEKTLVDLGNMSGKQNSGGDYFYSRLYMSLYLEAKGDTVRSKQFMQDAVESYYGQQATADYMTAVARVHLTSRSLM